MTSTPKDEAPRVYLAGEEGTWRERLYADHFPWGHVPVRNVHEADVLFLWLPRRALSPKSWYEIGLAEGLGKPVHVGAPTAEIFNDFGIQHADMFDGLKQTTVNPDVRDAYETVMADLDIVKPTVFVLRGAPQAGLCRGCGGSYQKHEVIHHTRRHGCFHRDCFERMKNPQEANAAVFTSALVEALRRENASLEERLRGK